ncbi:MAG: D-tagatose-bisphosphate aldolase, class II, non-catalytic subunit [Woeseiaceae bacterium]|nr:D-tagatose-bisphosphate aldolase, class II, non-catalytic subunit [Woeseiaceae bacterium]
MNSILDIVKAHKAGESVGIYSVCSAHPIVIEAALRRAKSDGTVALIEATSNQVNQDGGYTGMRADEFRDFVYRIAEEVDFPISRIVLGGDHLGPNCWQGLPADEAMQKSEVLIDQYVAAGFRKIHLDCSMSCSGDSIPLNDDEVASRAARLCAVAERSWLKSGGEAPVYIVGTEVPVPGGATEDLEELRVTEADAAASTIATHQAAFSSLSLDSAWSRVVGLVVQPGVEFDHEKTVDYDSRKAADLSRAIESNKQLIFEAHSTDYQTPENLRALVRDHYAILKVGPALTFALREALWALDRIEQEWIGDTLCVNLRKTVLDTMNGNPTYWKNYYFSAGEQLNRDLQYSLSDRVRYYWPTKEIEDAVARLINSLEVSPPPLTLLMQYMPVQYAAIRQKTISNKPKELLIHKIDEVLVQYSIACNRGVNRL